MATLIDFFKPVSTDEHLTTLFLRREPGHVPTEKWHVGRPRKRLHQCHRPTVLTAQARTLCRATMSNRRWRKFIYMYFESTGITAIAYLSCQLLLSCLVENQSPSLGSYTALCSWHPRTTHRSLASSSTRTEVQLLPKKALSPSSHARLANQRARSRWNTPYMYTF